MRKKWLTSARQLIGPAMFVVIWYLATAYLGGNEQKFPSPVAVVRDFGVLFGRNELIQHILTSMGRVLSGYFIAVAVAVPLGIVMGLYVAARELLEPFFEVLRPIPGLAWLPLLLGILGIGTTLSVSVVFIAALFPILVNCVASVKSVNRRYEQAAMTLGANRGVVIREVVLPAAFPDILTGLRVGMSVAWMSIIGAELIGARQGLGFMIMWYQNWFEPGKVAVGMVTIGIIGFLLDKVLRYLEARLAPWRAGLK